MNEMLVSEPMVFDSSIHDPAMAAEVMALLGATRPARIVDATLGTGGHALLLLREVAHARLLGLDRDSHALAVAAERLGEFGARVILRHRNFADLARVMEEAGFEAADAIVADLGMSSFALDDPARGMSFMREGPLDMRMDRERGLRAYDLINEESEEELARIIYELGEERGSRRIARAIAQARREAPVETTGQLREIIEYALGAYRRGGIHPATRTFQALRIAVNDEMGALRELLAQAPRMLAPGGRLAVIGYHSLEDRQVKHSFRELAASGGYRLLSRKAIRPQADEIRRNPRARSARLRCLERVP
jgi:16S rRNA (cytosine1402-N4)-methyltransferase